MYNPYIPKPNPPVFYIVGGYANSGKSTLIANLRQHFKVFVVSASAEVHKQYRLAHNGADLDCKVPDQRQLFIDWVEGTYIAQLGRDRFIEGLISDALLHPSIDQYSAVVIETVGGEEFDLIMGSIPWDCKYRTYNCNRKDSLPGVDIRQPLPNANELDCNEYWPLYQYRQWFPELQPKLLMPIPDSISYRLGNRIEYSCIAPLEDGMRIYSLTGEWHVIDNVMYDPYIDVGEKVSGDILASLTALRRGNFDWGGLKLNTTASGKLSVRGGLERVFAVSSDIVGNYTQMQQLMGWPAYSRYREDPATLDYTAKPKSLPPLRAAPWYSGKESPPNNLVQLSSMSRKSF